VGGLKTVSATGSLTLNAGPNNPASSTVGPGTTALPMLQVQLTASAAETLQITSFKIKGNGTGNELTHVDSVALVADLNGNGTYEALVDTLLSVRKAFAADDGTIDFTFSPAYSLPAGQSRTWLVTYDLESSIPNNSTFQARIELASYVSVTGKTSGQTITPTVNVPLGGGVKTVNNVGVLTLTAGANNPGPTTEATNAENVPVLQLNLAASNAETLAVDTISFNAFGTINHATDVLAVKLYRDANDNGQFDPATDYQIAAQKTIADSAGSARFVISTGDSLIPPGTSQNWLVLVSLNGQASSGETFGLKVSVNDSARTHGRASGVAAGVIGAPVSSATKTITTTGSLTLSAGPNNPAASTIASSGTNQPMVQFRLTTSSTEPVEVRRITLRASGTAHDTLDISTGGIKVYYDANSNGAYDAGVDQFIIGGTRFSNDNGFLVLNSVGRIIPAGTTQDWLVTYDLNGNASNGETFIAFIQKSEIIALGTSSGDTITVSGSSSVTGGTKTVSSQGTLSITVGPNSPSASSVGPSETNLVMVQVQLSASSAETLLVSSLTFKAEGTGHDVNALTNLRLYDDLNENGVYDTGVDTALVSASSYSADNGLATLTLGGSGYVMPPGTVHRWLVLYNLNGTALNGQTFQTTIPLNSYVTAKNTSGSSRSVTGAPVNGAVMTINNVGVLTASAGPNNPTAGNEAAGAENVVVLQVRMTASTAETLAVSRVSINATGTLNHATYLTAAKLYRDVNSNGHFDPTTDTQLAAAQTFADSAGSVRFVITSADSLIPPGSSQDWLVLASVSSSAPNGKTFSFRIAANDSIAVRGRQSATTATATGTPLISATRTVSNVGSLTIAPGPNNPGASNVAANATGVPMLQIRFTASSTENIVITGFTLRAAGTANDVTDITSGGIRLYHDANSNGIYDVGTDRLIASGLNFAADDDTVRINVGSEVVNAGASTDWLVVYDLNGNASNGETFIARVLSGGITAAGQTSGVAITAGGTSPTAGGTKTVSTQGTLTMALGSNSPPARTFSGTATKATVLQLQLSASSAETLLVTQVVFKGSGTGNEATEISAVWLYDDLNNNGSYDAGVDTALTTSQTFSADNGTATFTMSGASAKRIPSGATRNWLVLYDMNNAANNGTFRASIELNSHITATNLSSASRSVIGAPITGAYQTVSNAGVLTISLGTSNPAASNEAASADPVEMMQIKLSASSAESLRVDAVTFTAEGTLDDHVDISTVRLYRDLNGNGRLDLASDTQIDSVRTFASDNETVTFTAAVHETLAAGATTNWLLVYGLAGTGSAGETFRARINANSDLTVVGLERTGDPAASVLGAPLIGNYMTITSTGSLTLSVGPANPGNSNEDSTATNVEMVQFRLTASSVEDIDVEHFALFHNGTADQTTTIKPNGINVYRDVNSNGLYDPGTDVFIASGHSFGKAAVSFDGSDYLTADGTKTNFLAGKSAATFEAWVYPTSAATMHVFGKEYYLVGLSAGRLYCAVYTSGFGYAYRYLGTATVNQNQWNHIAVTYNGSALKGYINGQYAGENAQTGTLGTNVGTFYLGVRNVNNGYFSGTIDEARISDVVRYSTSFVPSSAAFHPDEHTMLLWHLDEGSGTTTADLSSTGATGTFASGTNEPTWVTQTTPINASPLTIFTSGQTISAGQPVDWLVVYDLGGSDTASVGQTFVASVTPDGVYARGATSAVQITAGGSTVGGGTKTISATGSLTIVAGSNNPGPSTEGTGTVGLPMLQLQLSASAAESLQVHSLVVKGLGTANEPTAVDSVTLYYDVNENGQYDALIDVQLGNKQVYTSDDGTVTFAFSPARTIPAGQAQHWLVVYNLKSNIPNGSTMQARVELANYVYVVGKTSGETVPAQGNFPVVGGLKTISNVGQMTVAAGANTPGATNETAGSDHIPMLQLSLSASGAESLRVTSIALKGTGTLNHATKITEALLYRDVNTNGTFEPVTDQLIAPAQTFADSAGFVRFTLSTPDTIIPNGSRTWLVLASLSSTADSGKTFGFRLTANDSAKVTGVQSGQTASVLGSPIQGATKTVQNIGTLSLAVGPFNPGASTISANETNLPMLQFRLTASSAEAVAVDTVIITAQGTADDTADIALNGIRLYKDVNSNGIYDASTDQLIGTASAYTANDGTATFLTTGQQIAAGGYADYLLIYNLKGTASGGETFIARVQKSNVRGRGLTSLQRLTTAGVSLVTGGTKTVSASGTLTIAAGTNNPQPTTIGAADSAVTMMQVQVSASVETLLVTHFRVKASGTGNDASGISSVRLFDDLNNNGVYDCGVDTLLAESTTYTINDTVATFALSGSGKRVAPNVAYNWLVVYNFAGTAPNGATFRTTIELNNYVTATSLGGSPRTVTGAVVTGAYKTVSTVGVLTITKGSNSPSATNIGPASQGVTMLQIHLAASSAESLRVESLTITATGTGNDQTGVSAVTLWRDLNSNGQRDLTSDVQIDSSRTFSADNGTITFSALAETLAAGATKDLLVVYDMTGTATSGQTFAPQVASNSHVAVKGLFGTLHSASVTGAPFTGSTKTVSTTGTLTISAGPANPGMGNIDSLAQDVPMVQVRLTASSVEDIVVRGIAVRHNGTGNAATDIKRNSIEVYRDANSNGQLDYGTDIFLGYAEKFTGNQLSFDGSDRVTADGTATNFLGGKSEATWEAWIYPTSTATQHIIGKEYYLIGISSSRLYCAVYTSGFGYAYRYLGTATVTLNQWNHIAVTFNGTALKGYINGVYAGENAQTGLLGSNTGTFYLGVRNVTNGYFSGKIDEVRISDIVRYPSNFTPPTVPFTTDNHTLLLWHLDEGSGTTTADASSNSITGTLAAAPNQPTWEASTASFAGNRAVINTPDQTVSAGTSQDWLVLYDFGGTDTASVGETFAAQVEPAGISLTGGTSGTLFTASGSNVVGGQKTVSAVGTLTLATGANNPDPGNIAASTLKQPMLQLTLSASGAESLLVSQFKVKALGSGNDLTEVDSVRVYLDANENGVVDEVVDTHLKATKFSADDGIATFDFSPSRVLPAGQTQTWLITYDMAGGIANGKTFQARFELASYVAVTGKTSGQTITASAAVPLVGGQKTISNVGHLTATTGANTPGASNEAADAQDVVVWQFRLAASAAESLRVDTVSITGTGTIHHKDAISAVKLYRDLNSDGLYSPAVDVQRGTTKTFADSAGTVRFVVADTITANTYRDYLVVYSLNGTAPNGRTFGAKITANDSVRVMGLEGASDHAATVSGMPIASNLKTVRNVGTLTVVPGSANPGPTTELATAQNVPMVQIKLSTSSSEAIRVSSVTVRALGTANDMTAIANNGIKLYQDVNNNGILDAGTDVFLTQAAAFSADNGTATLTLTGKTIAASSVENWLLTYNLGGTDTASVGQTFIARVLKTEISAKGVTTDSVVVVEGTSPITGGTKTVAQLGTLTLGAGSNNPGASTEGPSTQNLAMLQLRLSASLAETLLVSSVTVKSSGTANEASDVTSVHLRRDANSNGVYEPSIDDTLKYLGTHTFAADNDTVVFIFTAPETLAAGTYRDWLVVYNLSGAASNGETFRASVELASYVTLTGKTTGQAITPIGSFPIQGGLKTISNVGTLTLSLGPNNPGATNEAKNAQGIVMMQMRLAASAAESLRVDTLRITASGTINDLTDITEVRLYRDVNSNGLLDYSTDTQIGTGKTYSADDGTITFPDIADTLAPSATRDWLIVYDMADSASAGETFRVSVTSNGQVSAYGIESSAYAAVTGGPLTGSLKTITTTGQLSLAAGPANPGVSNITADAQGVAMVQFRLTASSAESVQVKGLSVQHLGTATPTSDVALNGVELYRDVNSNGVLDTGTDEFIASATRFNGYALSFDGSDYVTADGTQSNFLAGKSAATFEAWVYPTSTGTMHVFGKEYYLVGLSAGRLYCAVYTTGFGYAYRYLGTATVTQNQWNHVAVTYNGSTLRGYINGQYAGENAQTGTLGSNTGTFYLGVRNVNNGFFSGRIDEARISDVVRYTGTGSYTVPQSQFLPDSNTKLLWHMDTGSGTSVSDASASNITGTLGSGGAQPTWVTSTATFANNRAALVISSQTIPKGTYQDWLVVYNLSDSASLGETFIAQIPPGAITAQGVSSGQTISVSGNSVSGGVKTVSAVGSISWTAGPSNPGASGIDKADTNVTMMQLQLTASSAETLLISQLKVRGTGTGDELTAVASAENRGVRLYRDVNSNGVREVGTDVQLGSAQGFTADNGTVTFALSTPETLLAGQTKLYLIVYNYTGSGITGRTFQTTVNLTSDITVTGKTSGQSITPTGSLPITGGVKTISTIGTLTLTLGPANPSATNEANTAQNVPMLQVNLAANSVENIGIDTLLVTAAGTGADQTYVTAVKLYKDANNNGIADAGETQLSTTKTYSADNGAITFNLAAAETINAGTSQNWLVVYSFGNSGPVGSTFRATISANSSVKAKGGLSGSAQVIGAPINGNLKTLSATGTLTITTGPANPGNKTVLTNATGVAMMQFSLVASSVETVQVHSITFTHEGTGASATDINGVKLYRDKDNNGLVSVGDDSIGGAAGFSATGDTVKLSLTNINLPADSTERWLLVYNFLGTATTGKTFRARLLSAANVYATGKVSLEQIIPAKAARGAAEVCYVPVTVVFKPMVEDTSEARARGKVAFTAISGGQVTTAESGTLTITVGSNSPAAGTITINRDSIAVFQITFAASELETLTVTQVRMVGTGTADRPVVIDSVRFYLDVNGNGLLDASGDGGQLSAKAFSVGNDTVTFSGLSIAVPPSGSRHALALIKTNGLGFSGRTFSLNVPNKSMITATGNSSGNPVSTSRMVMTEPLSANTQTFQNGQVTVTGADIVAAGVDTGQQNVPVLRLTLSVSGPGVTIQSLKVDNAFGGGSLTYAAADIESLKVYKDTNGNLTYDIGVDSLVGRSLVTGTGGGSGTVTWGAVDTLRASASRVYLVVYDFATGGVGNPAHGFGAYLGDSSYVTLSTGVVRNTNFPIQLQSERSLPVELVGFTAEVVNQTVVLRWITESEVDNLTWIVERRPVSDDSVANKAAKFAEIHRLAGAGSTPYRTNYEFIDRSAQAGMRYAYRIVDVSKYGIPTTHPEVQVVVLRPERLALSPAWPNPANPVTSWTYTLPEDAHVRVMVYNALGQQVRVLLDERVPAGVHLIRWDGADGQGRSLASGMYLYVLETPKGRLVGKLTMLR